MCGVTRLNKKRMYKRKFSYSEYIAGKMRRNRLTLIEYVKRRNNENIVKKKIGKIIIE